MVGEQTLRTTNHQLVVVECTVAVSIETKSTTSHRSNQDHLIHEMGRCSISSGGTVSSISWVCTPTSEVVDSSSFDTPYHSTGSPMAVMVTTAIHHLVDHPRRDHARQRRSPPSTNCDACHHPLAISMDVEMTRYANAVDVVPRATPPTTPHVVVEEVSISTSHAVCTLIVRVTRTASVMTTPWPEHP